MKRIITILLIVVSALPVFPNVVITQVLYDSPLNEVISRPPYSNGEFVELHNTDCSPVDLTGWYLHGGGKTEVYIFPGGFRIPANGYVAVAYQHNQTPDFRLDSIIVLPNAYTVLYQRKIILSNSGEGIALYNASDVRVDTMRYTASQATNQDSVPLSVCRSLHRIAYACDENGNALCRLSDWESGTVSFKDNTAQQTWLPSSGYYSAQSAISTGAPYIVSITARSQVDSISSVDGQVCVNGGGMAQVAVEWCNPLGKNMALMQRKQTPMGKNLVSLQQNTDGYTIRQWLPVPVETEELMTLESFSSLATDWHEDGAPYSETRMEHNAGSRVVETTKAGVVYINHPAVNTYGVNAANEVARWRVQSNGATKNGTYPAGMLHKYTHADEDGKTTTRYMDAQGRLVMLRIANDAETYYLYDDLGRLRYVLPPLASSSVGSTFTDATDKIKQYAYCYSYDARGNCIKKKLPGCEPLYMVYDMAGRQVLSQDGNQRARGHYWTMARYTETGLLALTAEILAGNSDLAGQVQYWEDKSAVVSFATDNGASTGYAVNEQVVQTLIVNYYDNYNFLTLLSDNERNALTYNQRDGYGVQHANATGLLTGKRVYSLSGNTYTATACYYDKDGHVIQQRSTLWNGGSEIICSAYNFDGTINKTMEELPDIAETYRYEYDMAGRLIRTRYALNDEEEILMAHNFYSELGRLDTCKRHNDTDTERFEYDIRGNTTKIRSGDFMENITYANNGFGYNGIISSASFEQDGISAQWDYGYDNHNRLVSAYLTQGGNSCAAEGFTYDPMGNILTLKRRNFETLLDDLAYSYSGNQLTAVSDDAGEQSLYNQKEYLDLSNGGNEMIYDENGNLVQDFDRKICTIQYNVLNLPTVIQFCDGNSIINTYNAEGVKLSTTYYTLPEAVTVPVGKVLNPDTLPQAPQVMTVEYCGHMDKTTIGDSTSYCLHLPNGYISMDSLHTIVDWSYFRCDHLGNNVAVWSATADSTIQRSFYYPSGLPMAISTGQSAQPYKYNGKEFVEMHGYDVYEYGFRGYYATIARFTSIDPLCEQTPWQAPYCYASNNFTGEIDWMGLWGFVPEYRTTYGWMAQDSQGKVVAWGDDNNDFHVYEVDENWDRTYEGLVNNYSPIGWEIFDENNQRPRYKEGKRTYYVGSVTTVSYRKGVYNVWGGKALMYGNNRVNIKKSINTNKEAVAHYYFGKGEPICNGELASCNFMLTSDFWGILIDVILGNKCGVGMVDFRWRGPQFHIGRTTYSYQVSGKTVFIGFALNDGFWDPRFITEKISDMKGIKLADGKGPNLEAGGTPYDYIPSVIIVNLY